jgi:hypothetical protein
MAGIYGSLSGDEKQLKPHQPHSRCDCDYCQSGFFPAHGLESHRGLEDGGDESGETNADLEAGGWSCKAQCDHVGASPDLVIGHQST